MTSTKTVCPEPATGGIAVPAPSEIEGVLSVPLRAPDPYMDPCPAWCGGQHLVASEEKGRDHYGLAYFVPVRSLPTTYVPSIEGNGEIAFSDVCVSLERPALHREPRIRLQASGLDAIFLSVEEAQQIADCLRLLVKESQR